MACGRRESEEGRRGELGAVACGIIEKEEGQYHPIRKYSGPRYAASRSGHGCEVCKIVMANFQ